MVQPVSEDTQVNAQLKDDLRRKVIDYLVKNKKADLTKLVKSIDSSSARQQLVEKLVATEAPYYQSQGASEFDARRSAEQHAAAEAKRIVDETAAQPAEGLRKRAEESVFILESLGKGCDTKVKQAQQLINAIDELMHYEFIKDVTSKKALVIKWDRGALKSAISAGEKRKKEADQLRLKVQAVQDNPDVEKLRKVLVEYEKSKKHIRDQIDEASKQLESVANECEVTINAKGLEAYVSQIVMADDKAKIEHATTFATFVVGGFSSAFKLTAVTGTIVRAADLALAVMAKGAKDKLVQEGVQEFEKQHTLAEMRLQHDRNPLLIAKELVKQQKAALDLLIKTIGVTLSGAMIAAEPYGSAVMQVWEPVSKAVQIAIESHLKERIQISEAAVKAELAKEPAPMEAASTAKGIFTAAREGLEEDLKKNIGNAVSSKAGDFAGGLLNALKGKKLTDEMKNAAHGLEGIVEKPGDFTSVVLDWVMPPIMEVVWKFFPPEPAQLISGKELASMIDTVAIAQLPPGFLIVNASSLPKAEPGEPIKDRPADIKQEVWDRFVETNDGRTQFRDDPAKCRYYVAQKVAGFAQHPGVLVWGYFDPRSGKFSPEAIDESHLGEDWSARTIFGAGFDERDELDKIPEEQLPQTKGKWHIVTVGEIVKGTSSNRRYVLFKDGSGQAHWGRTMDHVKGPRGVKYLLGRTIEPFADLVDLTA